MPTFIKIFLITLISFSAFTKIAIAADCQLNKDNFQKNETVEVFCWDLPDCDKAEMYVSIYCHDYCSLPEEFYKDSGFINVKDNLDGHACAQKHSFNTPNKYNQATCYIYVRAKDGTNQEIKNSTPIIDPHADSSMQFTVIAACVSGPTPTPGPSPTPAPLPTTKPPIDPSCNSNGLDYLPSTFFSDGQGIRTALGCIPYYPLGIVGWVLIYIVPLGGGIGFLMLLAGTFGVMTSAGNPEKLQKAQQLITSAIAGMLFIIFGVYLLNLIGVQIFKIPGL